MRPRSPRPCTTSSEAEGSSIATPIARSACAVETLSSPCENSEMREAPSQSAATSKARCPMLLSEGTGTLPTSGRSAGWTTSVVTVSAPGALREVEEALHERAVVDRRTPARTSAASATTCTSSIETPPRSGPSRCTQRSPECAASATAAARAASA